MFASSNYYWSTWIKCVLMLHQTPLCKIWTKTFILKHTLAVWICSSSPAWAPVCPGPWAPPDCLGCASSCLAPLLAEAWSTNKTIKQKRKRGCTRYENNMDPCGTQIEQADISSSWDETRLLSVEEDFTFYPDTAGTVHHLRRFSSHPPQSPSQLTDLCVPTKHRGVIVHGHTFTE